MEPSKLFEQRVTAILFDFNLCRVPVEPDRVRDFVDKVFCVPTGERDRIVQAVLERANPPPPPPDRQRLPAAWQNELRRLGMAKTKRHQKTKEPDKVSYSRWCYAKTLIRRLQKQKGMSLNDIGLQVKGSNAWAGAALDYNGMVAERDIKQMENLLGVPRKGRRGRTPVADRIERKDQAKLAKILFNLREKHGWTHALIAQAIGVGPAQVGKIITKGGGSRPVLDRALYVWESVNQADSDGALRDLPRPEPVDEEVRSGEAAEPVEEVVQPEAEPAMARRIGPDEPYVPPKPVEIPPTEVTLKKGQAREPVAVLDDVTKMLLEAADLLTKTGDRLPPAFASPWHRQADAIMEIAEILQG